MYAEETKTGKFKFVESYTDPMTGKRKRVSITLNKNTAAARKEAQKYLDGRIKDILAHSGAAPESLDIEAALRLCLDAKEKTVKPSTARSLRSQAANIEKILGAETRLDKLNAYYINSRLLATGLPPGTMNNHLSAIKAFLNWCYKNDLIESVEYLQKLEKYKTENKALKTKYLERDELGAVIDLIKAPENKYAVMFLALTGMRAGEMAALTTSDVNIFTRTISINKTWNRESHIATTPKTDTSTRNIYIQDELLDLIKEIDRYYARRRPGRKLFFINVHGRRMDVQALRRIFQAATLEATGKEITLHTLRHTHASLLFESGMSLEAVSLRLGHRGSEITREVYLHITERKQDEYNAELKGLKLLDNGTEQP